MNKFKYKWVIITLLIVLSIMMMIFLFSTQSKEASASLSGKYTKIVIKILDFIHEYFPTKPSDDIIIASDYNYFEDVNYYVRKVAHLTEFGLLGAALIWHISTIMDVLKRLIDKKSICIALMISFFYACLDEIHQLFVDGRGPQIKDVIIDSVGSFLGIVLVYIILLKIKQSPKFNLYK